MAGCAVLGRAWPYMAVVYLQFSYALLNILAKAALGDGMNPFTFVFYRHAVASVVLVPLAFLLERNVRPRMTLLIFLKIMMLGFLEPVADQGMYYTGMKLTSATFAAAMANLLPSLVFFMSWILRLERVNMKKIRSLAKVFGTLISLAGAMTITLYHGLVIELPWSRAAERHRQRGQGAAAGHGEEDRVVGPIFVTFACCCWAGFVVLQALVLRDYPAEMSLAAMLCVSGTVQGAVAALLVVVVHRDRSPSAWAIGWDMKLITIVYGGIVCSSVAYYLQGVLLKKKGPVFVTAFCPLNMIIVVILGSFFLSEEIYLGRVIGAVIIVLGLYSVVWGKLKDNEEEE